jgi:predicted PolB exonuclease-like 3'-5' exonuclease
MSIIFDIETGALPRKQLQEQMPEFAPPGNIKDPKKIALKLAEKEAKFMADAALNAETLQVLAIGMYDDETEEVTIITENTETETIGKFWDKVCTGVSLTEELIGFNSNNFDIPVLVRRSYILGLSVPHNLRQRWIPDFCIDLMEMWQCGDRQKRISLDRLCKLCGLEGKNGSGKYFSQMFEEDREGAIEYLINDIKITAKLAKRMIK